MNPVRTLHHRSFTAAVVAATRERSISVCLPARDEAATIGPILDQLIPLRERGVIDQVVVADDSTDGTGDIARERGAEVHNQADLMPEYGPVLGKGDALWRSLSVLTGDVVCFLDADSEEFGEHFALGLVGPVATGAGTAFAKAFYRRPWRTAGGTEPEGGGRVTELLARPFLSRFYPELSGFHQPLAGEVAARRELLMSLPFATGYAVDVALLIDAFHAVGIDALAQVDLDVRQNQHQTLAELGPMAAQVLVGMTSRMEREGRIEPSAAVVERPPMRDARHTSMATDDARLHSV